MDLKSLTARIDAEAALPPERARGLRAELLASLPSAPFAGAIPAGSFHLDLATALGRSAGGVPASVKLPFTVVF